MSCCAYRDFNKGKSGEIELYISDNYTVILFIAWLHENIKDDGEYNDIGAQAIMKVKYNPKIQLYDVINIIFDKITKDYSQKLENVSYFDYIVGTKLKDITSCYSTDNGQNAPAIPLTIENTKYISYIKDIWKNKKIIHGEIFENKKFVYEFPIISTTRRVGV